MRIGKIVWITIKMAHSSQTSMKKTFSKKNSSLKKKKHPSWEKLNFYHQTSKNSVNDSRFI